VSGFYDWYLRSEAWQRRRRAALERAGWRCRACGQRGGSLDVHHLTYCRLGHELPEDLCVLCRRCHEIAEALKKKP
jgi:hypothetical protein